MHDLKTHSGTKSSTFFVQGMCCSEEQHAIEKKLRTIRGIESCRVNLVNQKVDVVHTCSRNDIQSALHRLGFKTHEEIPTVEQASFWDKHAPLFSTVTSVVLITIGILLEQLGSSETVTIPLFLGAILIGGWRIARKGLKAAKNLSLDMNSLMTIAVIGAMAIGEWTGNS